MATEKAMPRTANLVAPSLPQNRFFSSHQNLGAWSAPTARQHMQTPIHSAVYCHAFAIRADALALRLLSDGRSDGMGCRPAGQPATCMVVSRGYTVAEHGDPRGYTAK